MEPILLGKSAAIETLRADIAQAARTSAKVLLTGESGTGKEIAARLIHASSARRRASLHTVNCAALAETLLEAELFGHVRGSFTGAHRDRPGVLELANGGTVFLDELGEMTPRMQGLLLRFLETGEIQRVGADQPAIHADVRVIAATNRSLMDAVEAKTFRADLYYRLNVLHISIPPLRDRREDVPLLLDYFLRLFSRDNGLPCPRLSDTLSERLYQHSWPGNVRELRNVAERLVAQQPNRDIRDTDLVFEADLRTAPKATSAPVAAPSAVDEMWHALIVQRRSFWSVVYAPFVSRDLTRRDVRSLVRRGLERTSGNYKVLVELFNMRPDEYKRFLAFLRKYNCHIPFQQFRTASATSLVAPQRVEPHVRLAV